MEAQAIIILILTRTSYLTTLLCQLGRYRLIRLPFRVAPAGGMFQQKIDEIFKDVPYVFGIADDILIVWYDADSRDHNRA